MTTIEKLAREAAKSFHASTEIDQAWPGYVPLVMNILTALREPGSGTLDAMRPHMMPITDVRSPVVPDRLGAWTAAIDHILAEKQP